MPHGMFSCGACDVPSFPKLNDYGNTFRDLGHQLETVFEPPLEPSPESRP